MTPRGPVVGLLAVALLVGCADEPLQEPKPPPIPDGHPCPGLALPPNVSSLWEDHRVSGEPVPLALLPPIPPALEAAISQGHHTSGTHQGPSSWAWDLDVPYGTPVLAAAPGVVVGVRQDSTLHGTGPEMAAEANFIVLDHGGGLYTAYVHLEANSALVVPGSLVEAGEKLGVTGASGQLTGPHLHFQVENAYSDSVPARFVNRDGASGCSRDPDKGDSLRRPEGARDLWVGWQTVSPLPADSFVDGGVLQVSGLPGRLSHRSDSLSLSGAAVAGATEVWLLVLPVEGGDALAAFGFPVSDGSFQGTIDLTGLPTGPTGWAMTATSGEDPEVERAIRVHIAP